MKKFLAGVFASVALCGFSPTGSAQGLLGKPGDCKACAAQYPTVSACVTCIYKYHGKARYSAKQIEDWCQRNQPQCYKK